MRTILFLDDEANILKALRRLFRNLEFDCYYACTMKEAVEIFLSLDQLDMLVTDIKMPYFDGIRVLKFFKEASPETIRVALSGYASTNSITEAVSKNLAKQYFFKPWDNEKLIESVRKMFLLEDRFKEVGLFKVIQAFEGVKTMPKMFNRINNMVQKDQSIEEICKVIEDDPAMTSNILRIANSAFYAAKTGNLQQAIMFIGLNNLKQLILSYELSSKDDKIFEKSASIWYHSERVNLIYHDLYEYYFKHKIPALIGTAGLLHDIGQIIMLQLYGTSYFKQIIESHYDDMSIVSKEEELFEINHAIVGGYFLNWWTFPLDLIEITLYHHDPGAEDIIHREEVALMSLASHIEKEELDPLQEDTKIALDILKLSVTSLEGIINKYNNK